MSRKLFSINTTSSRQNLILPGHDQPDYVQTVEEEVSVILGDGTLQSVIVHNPDSDFDQSNFLNGNCISLGIDFDNDREYFSCRSEIDITNLGGASADTLEWREETFPLSDSVSFRLLDSLTPDAPDDGWEAYKVLVESNIPRSLRYGDKNTAIQRVDDMGYSITQSFKDDLFADWDRENSLHDSSEAVFDPNNHPE